MLLDSFHLAKGIVSAADGATTEDHSGTPRGGRYPGAARLEPHELPHCSPWGQGSGTPGLPPAFPSAAAGKQLCLIIPKGPLARHPSGQQMPREEQEHEPAYLIDVSPCLVTCASGIFCWKSGFHRCIQLLL